MFNSSTAAGAGAMRPGPITGHYPERSDRESVWLDLVFNRFQGPWERLAAGRPFGLHRVAAAVGRLGESLATFDDQELDNRVMDLRRRFRSRGLEDTLCLQAFALIREAASRTIGQRHYDTQLMGAWVMLQGRLAEMETGEGKTLAATLAAATAALAGIPVHVLTVNEYLVRRDTDAMGPLYRALGLTVGYVTQDMTPAQSRAAYACDITYCTNKQVAFDYLRDRLLLGNSRSQLRLQLESTGTGRHRLGQLLLRGLCFAIIDEADGVLIDEACTPLILTRPAGNSIEQAVYRQVLDLTRGMIEGQDFFMDSARRDIQLSRSVQERLTHFQLPDNGFWQDPRSREELVVKALRALHGLRKDRDYLVQDGKVLIIDTNTGRTMPDRSWERGLHQLVEIKERCPLTDSREHLGRLTYQRFFRRYLRLGGMSGTVREVRSELWSVYGLRVQRIPLNRPSRRREWPAQVYPRAADKWAAVIQSIQEMQQIGRPVLIGTGSVADSETLSRRLAAAGIAHHLLNARQDEGEAEIVAAAGRKGQVTVATNMAGRGTDIPLADGVAELGGLHVIAACRNAARRIDRQLSGRCARQGDPGSHQAVLSLEDELIEHHIHPLLVRLLRRFSAKGGLLQGRLNLCLLRYAQRRAERLQRRRRRALVQHDRQVGRLLAFSGHRE